MCWCEYKILGAHWSQLIPPVGCQRLPERNSPVALSDLVPYLGVILFL